MAKVDTSPSRGMRDLLPREVAIRDHMTSVILDTYKEAGFVKIETPAVEDLDRLVGSGGGENEKLVFKILKRGEKLDIADEDSLADLGLRFDLTVPLSRYYAHNFAKLGGSILRSIQIGPVWRAERPQKGRYRQFVQCDIDVIGEASIVAELALISTTLRALKRLGIPSLTLRFNHRALLDQILEFFEIEVGKRSGVLIALDKLDKLTSMQVAQLIIDLGVDEAVATQLIERMSDLGEGGIVDSDRLKGIGIAEGVVEDLLAIASMSSDDEFGDVKFVFDPTVIRGMGYYTGPIFELSLPQFGFSIGGGGRYDTMLERFGRSAPACGFSIGFERVALYLEESGFNPLSDANVVHIRLSNPSLFTRVANIVAKLRTAKFIVDFDGPNRKADAQLKSYRRQYEESGRRGVEAFIDIDDGGTITISRVGGAESSIEEIRTLFSDEQPLL
ncbi:MAG: ATP phosphoribosyltransferase regulatory subunit [Actinomycetota bacterium]|nr:ATP phosphoribosyltransferase regulatory subunit [Actinomycetota bacterium]